MSPRRGDSLLGLHATSSERLVKLRGTAAVKK